jgi:pilus assembly protein CpaE
MQILSFLPSKAGVGASTVALNVSAVLAKKPDARVLLADFDLCAGMTRFLLKLNNEYSVADAAEHAEDIEDGLWQSMVTNVDGLDVLHSGRVMPNLHIQDGQIRSLMAFLQTRYRVLCFDLSANLEQYALALMKESTRVVMMCTPELPSLHLAGEKLAYFRTLELDRRISVVLNRCTKLTALSKDQVEQFLGRPVLQQLPNDYAGVAEAMAAGTCVAPKSSLGKSLTELASKLTDVRSLPPVVETERSRFWSLAARPAVIKRA